MSITLPRLQNKDAITQEDRTPSFSFQIYWQTFATAIEKAIDDVVAALAAAVAAQASADAAQNAAITALANAATAQTTATAAQGSATTANTTATAAQTTANTALANAATAQSTANAAVPKNATPAWVTPTGTLSRTGFSSYAGQTVSVIYVQAEAQTTDDQVKLLSQKLSALITDLRANGALT